MTKSNSPFRESRLNEFQDENEQLDKNELFNLFKEGEGAEYANAIKRNVVRIMSEG